jgi:signal transduction histidine kinase
LSPAEDCKRILFVSLKKEAEPVLAQLRAAGHQVSLVEDMDDAAALLASGAFDQTIVPCHTIQPLLAQRSIWERSGGDSWRLSTAAIAHDLRNLLSALERCTRELQEEAVLLGSHGDDLAQLQRTISTLSTFLLELIEEFGGGSGQSLAPQVFDLEDAVELAAISVYSSASERRQRLVIDIDERVRYIRADATKMKRVLSNLLLHASRQTPSLGTVTVLARRDSGDCVISVAYNAEAASIAGLTELLRPGEGSAPGGGLYGVQQMVQQHGGRLWVESERGSGTTVFVSVPSAEITHSESSFSIAPS